MKRIIRIIIFIVSVCFIFYITIGFIFYHFGLNANNTQSRAVGEKLYVPSDIILPSEELSAKEADKLFLQTTTPVKQTILSDDGLLLAGYTFKQPIPTDKWIFAVHGYTGSVRQMTRWIRTYYELGYNVFAPDLRGHGTSEGNYYGMGWLDQPDLMQWLQLLVQNEPNAHITLSGVSMGASAVLNLAASENLPDNVESVIADSPFTSVDSIFKTQLNDALHLPTFPILNAANTVAKWRIHLDFYEASTINLVDEINIPIYYIHGQADTFVPVQNVYDLQQATNAPNELWIVDEANHGEAIKVDVEKYKNTIQSFILKAPDK